MQGNWPQNFIPSDSGRIGRQLHADLATLNATEAREPRKGIKQNNLKGKKNHKKVQTTFPTVDTYTPPKQNTDIDVYPFTRQYTLADNQIDTLGIELVLKPIPLDTLTRVKADIDKVLGIGTITMYRGPSKNHIVGGNWRAGADLLLRIKAHTNYVMMRNETTGDIISVAVLSDHDSIDSCIKMLTSIENARNSTGKLKRLHEVKQALYTLYFSLK